MMTEPKPLSEVNHQAIRLLSEEIGVVDTFRFVNQFTTGHGNYTDERDALPSRVAAIASLHPRTLCRLGGLGAVG